MKFRLSILFLIITFSFITESYSQRVNYRITNGFNIFGGISKYNIITDNFIVEQGDGFLGGAGATVDIPHRWYNISFGMQLSENHLKIEGRSGALTNDLASIEYKLFAAQIALLGHIKLIGNNLTIDAGPMLQYNGKMELKDKGQKAYYINNYSNLSATDITNISQFNINGAIGATAGLDFIRLKAQYIYGFTNILKKLNTANLDTSGNDKSFKGNQSMLVLGALICF